MFSDLYSALEEDQLDVFILAEEGGNRHVLLSQWQPMGNADFRVYLLPNIPWGFVEMLAYSIATKEW